MVGFPLGRLANVRFANSTPQTVAGIIVAAVIPVIIILLLCCFLVKRRRQRANISQVYPTQQQQ